MDIQGSPSVLQSFPVQTEKLGPPAPHAETHPEVQDAQKHAAIVKAAHQFESVFLNQLMKAMRKTVPDSKLFNSKGPQKFYQQMQDAEMAKAMAKENGGMGIADLIVQQLSPHSEPQAAPKELKTIQRALIGPQSPETIETRYRCLSTINPDSTRQLRLRALAAKQGTAVADTLNRFGPQIQAACDDSGLSPELLLAVIMEESGGDPHAQSPKGAQGLMQLMPDTASEMGVENPHHPGQNLQGGAKYLSRMLKKYQGQLALALAAYNAGPGNVDRAGGAIPAFRETQEYVRRVMARYENLGGGMNLASFGGSGTSSGISPE